VSPASNLETMQGNSEHSPKLPPVAVTLTLLVVPCAAFRPGGSFRGCSVNYYQMHIGDYASHTRHLTNIEDLAYRRLLDLYYLQEKPIVGDAASVARQVNLRGHEDEVKAVLGDFFQETPHGWVNHRAEKEIAHYQEKREKASNAGRASVQRRLNVRSTDVQLTNNQEPITINQEPKSKRFAPPALDEVISEMTGRTQDPTHEANRFLAYYESNGWKVGRNPMKSWKAAVTNWVTKTKQPQLIDSSQTGLAARLTDTSWV
jgi:uncharacterized protein YdaU (DUF1376 family)